MPIDAVLGARHELVERENRLLLGAGREGKDDASNGGQKSASPRMRAAAADPDRVRHAPSPLLAATTAHCQRIIAGEAPRIARLYSQAESRRKSPDRERERDGTGLKPARRQRGAMTCRAPRRRAPCLPD